MTITNRIEINPNVMMGKPVVRGTRIPIELILRKLSEGATEDDLLDAYPRLKVEDIQAAIGYAADTQPGNVPLTDAQRQELDRRLDDLERSGPEGIPWDEVLQQIRNRIR